jgi:predicted transposase YbfD/YdcC
MTLTAHFALLIDPRIDRTKHYPLHSLIFLTVAAVVADCESFSQIADFAEVRLKWLQGHGHFLDGRTPSHDVLGKLYHRLDPKVFQRCFMRWTSEVCKITEGQLIAIDGKTLRGSHDTFSGKRAIHLISAWSSANQMVLAQMKVDGKSNEITAIPELLAVLDLKGAVVSIDAMGCQTDIASDIRKGGGHYLLGVKGNQATLEEQVEMLFVHHAPNSSSQQANKGHGRVETRTCDVIDNPALLKNIAGWPDLRSIIRVCSTRQRALGGAPTEEIRFYVSSAQADAQRFNSWVREHWGIENQVHWMLDVIFDEDGSRIRKGHADENMAIIRRPALNICRLLPDKKKSLARKRKAAAWSDEHLNLLLGL